MKQKLQLFLQHPLISGSIVLFFGGQVIGLVHLAFNIFMNRNMSVVDYGELASLISLTVIPGFLLSSITPTVINFGAIFFAKNELNEIRALFFTLKRFLIPLGLLFLILIVVFQYPIAHFFHINNNSLLILVGVSIFVSFASSINMALLQAKLDFTFTTIVNLIGAILKCGLGVVLVLSGFSVAGALGAIIISGFIAYLLTFIPLRFVFEKNNKKANVPFSSLMRYGFPSAVAVASLTSFITADILLVKHFFDPHTAGLYAGLSLIGKIIFYFSAPIGTVMFPLVAQKHAKNQGHTQTFLLSLFLVLIPSVLLTVLFFAVPDFVISLINKQYVEVSYLLGIVGIFISIYALLSMVVNYMLSIKKVIVCIPIFLASLLQITLIWIYHESLYEILYISIFTSSLLLFILLIYYLRLNRRGI